MPNNNYGLSTTVWTLPYGVKTSFRESDVSLHMNEKLHPIYVQIKVWFRCKEFW